MSSQVPPPRDRSISEGSEPEEEPKFEPVITLPEVEVPTHEENEDVLLKMRAKLYRFDSNEENFEWKERGTGEVKLLRHRCNNTVRVVMRRDKTLKVCANHFVTPYMDLKPSYGCEKAFVYTVPADFADEQLKAECLAIKFANVENAKLFKEKFNEAKEIVKDMYKKLDEDFQEEWANSDSRSDSNASTKENTPNDGEEEQVTKKLSELDVAKEE